MISFVRRWRPGRLRSPTRPNVPLAHVGRKCSEANATKSRKRQPFKAHNCQPRKALHQTMAEVCGVCMGVCVCKCACMWVWVWVCACVRACVCSQGHVPAPAAGHQRAPACREQRTVTNEQRLLSKTQTVTTPQVAVLMLCARSPPPPHHCLLAALALLGDDQAHNL